MTNESLLILGLLTPLFAAFGSYCFKNNINVRDSFGVIGGVITFLISLKIFNGLQADEQYVINLFTLFKNFLEKSLKEFVESLIGKVVKY